MSKTPITKEMLGWEEAARRARQMIKSRQWWLLLPAGQVGWEKLQLLCRTAREKGHRCKTAMFKIPCGGLLENPDGTLEMGDGSMFLLLIKKGAPPEGLPGVELLELLRLTRPDAGDNLTLADLDTVDEFVLGPAVPAVIAAHWEWLEWFLEQGDADEITLTTKGGGR